MSLMQAEETEKTLADCMTKALYCCHLYGIYLLIKDDMKPSDINLDSHAFIDVLCEADLQGMLSDHPEYDREIPILAAEECQSSYSNFFFPGTQAENSSETETETETEEKLEDDDETDDPNIPQFVPTEEQLNQWKAQLFGQLSGRIAAIFKTA